MSHNRILDVIEAKWTTAPRLVLAAALLVAFAATPLHAQYSYTDWYDFQNCGALGCAPLDLGRLTQGSDGNLYGTTLSGGSHAFGTIFVVTPTGTYNDLWEFDGVSGESPYGGLTLASDGNFYGAAAAGGSFNDGTVFRFTPPGTVTVIHNFNGTDGINPTVPPVQGKDGNLYGVTLSGTTYTITMPAGTFKQLPQNSPPTVYAPLFLASDGNLYGVSAYGGTNNDGTVFRMTTPGGAINVIHNFNGSDGINPVGPLTQGSDGYLYGTALSGGANNAGADFKMTLAGKKMQTFSFDALSGTTNNDGAGPQAGLLAASDGYLYGVNQSGGANGFGTIYQISVALKFTKLFDFTASVGPVTGQLAATTLMQHTNGSLYGLTQEGGAAGDGNFYGLTAINFREILTVIGPIFVKPGVPVQILGNNLTHVIQVNFGAVQAQFQTNSDTLLTATVPFAALDGPVSAIFDTGLEFQTQSAVHILPVILSLDPLSGPVGTPVNISGGGFTGATKVTFGGVRTGNFIVVTPSQIQATVPTGAKTGKVAVTTPNGSATSTQKFTVN
jgi:uncharacterized repeat protein (TIGR03803 family)